MEEKIKEKKILLVPITAQPPTFGMAMSIMGMVDSFDEIIICIEDNPIVIQTNVVVKMLELVFRKPKFTVISNPTDFALTNDFPPDLPSFNFIAAINDRIYANLSSKNIPCFLLLKAVGYDEVFHRCAYRQSQELEMLRMRMALTSINKQPNHEPEVEDGE
jgi:hypothetical protein